MTQLGSDDQYIDVSTAIIEAVADHEDVDPLELEPPLYDVIDLDAVETLVEQSPRFGTGESVEISFTYNGAEVEVTGTGEVRVLDATFE